MSRRSQVPSLGFNSLKINPPTSGDFHRVDKEATYTDVCNQSFRSRDYHYFQTVVHDQSFRSCEYHSKFVSQLKDPVSILV